jgi:hypothetical protein
MPALSSPPSTYKEQPKNAPLRQPKIAPFVIRFSLNVVANDGDKQAVGPGEA